jgi:hypothetical protein
MTKTTSFTSLIATFIFVLLLVALHVISNKISPILYGISYYAFGDFGDLICIALISVGIGGVMLGITKWSSTFSRMGRAGIILLITWGFLSIFAGLFPLDPPNSHLTLSGVIHNIAGRNVILVVPGVFLIELATAKSYLDFPNKNRRLSLAWFLLLATVLMFIFNVPYAHLGFGGAFQRLYWFALTLWLITAAYQQFRQTTDH